MPADPDIDPHAAVMNTVSGRQFSPFDPSPADVALADIAHGLSHICRCSGQVRQFYSVGLHSLYVSRNLRERDAGPRVQLYGLLHDAAEAYVSDVVAPVKRHLDGYQRMEAAILDAVWTAFDVPGPTDREWQEIKAADRRLRQYELDTLLPEVVEDEVPALGYDLDADAHRDVAAEFTDRAETLVGRTDATLP